MGQVCGDYPQTCNTVCTAAFRLVERMSGFITLLKDKHQFTKGTPDDEQDSEAEPTTYDDIKNDLTENVQEWTRKVCWFLGLVSFNLVNIKVEELTAEQLKDETNDQKMTRVLMDSKVLSGGIENRFISTFGNETKEILKPVLEFY
jgi:hypothetical protein